MLLLVLLAWCVAVDASYVSNSIVRAAAAEADVVRAYLDFAHEINKTILALPQVSLLDYDPIECPPYVVWCSDCLRNGYYVGNVSEFGAPERYDDVFDQYPIFQHTRASHETPYDYLYYSDTPGVPMKRDYDGE